MIILEAQNLSYVLHRKKLIDDINIAFNEGELTTIIGPNGAGKSTLTRLLCGELRPTHGSVVLNGHNIHTIAPWRLACMRAVMPQASQIIFPFSVSEVVSLGVAGIGKNLSKEKRRQIASYSLEQADISHLKDRVYQTLSGGEKQRVHFARVLAQLGAGQSLETKQILFLDEPIASLDLKHQLQLLNETKKLTEKGLTVIAVLHDLQLSADIADRIIALSHGKVICSGLPSEVLTQQRIEDIFEVSLVSGNLPPSPWQALHS
ncbi:heme ABC transporter ATP-binding protein [Microvirga sp. W0021]|uniref:Heme ABC transporter ATP-binding protein n=1 Tax=Hohaiivirga grylli TaxID=3133970 RepID=A0ABV0BII1_9HYPH